MPYGVFMILDAGIKALHPRLSGRAGAVFGVRIGAAHPRLRHRHRQIHRPSLGFFLLGYLIWNDIPPFPVVLGAGPIAFAGGILICGERRAG